MAPLRLPRGAQQFRRNQAATIPPESLKGQGCILWPRVRWGQEHAWHSCTFRNHRADCWANPGARKDNALCQHTLLAHHSTWGGKTSREGSVGTHYPALPTCMWPREVSLGEGVPLFLGRGRRLFLPSFGEGTLIPLTQSARRTTLSRG